MQIKTFQGLRGTISFLTLFILIEYMGGFKGGGGGGGGGDRGLQMGKKIITILPS